MRSGYDQSVSEADVARRMADLAGELLSSLDDGQRSLAQNPFDSADRRTWTYLPGDRPGLPIHRMDRSQSRAALRLLAAGVSVDTFARATAVMAQEDPLEVSARRTNRERTLTDYWCVVYGEPGLSEPWSWRFEGHHLSINHTVVDGVLVRPAPAFLGANPARVMRDGVVVLAPLRLEEDVAFELLAQLSPAERGRATVAAEAPEDILTRDRPEVSGVEPEGLPVAELSGDAGDLADRLVRLYLDRLPAALADRDTDGIHLAWAGGDRHGQPHYYRLHGPRFLAELDNTQDDADHVHSVWRDPRADFGRDLLADHHRAHHS